MSDRYEYPPPRDPRAPGEPPPREPREPAAPPRHREPVEPELREPRNGSPVLWTAIGVVFVAVILLAVWAIWTQERLDFPPAAEPVPEADAPGQQQPPAVERPEPAPLSPEGQAPPPPSPPPPGSDAPREPGEEGGEVDRDPGNNVTG